MASPDVARYAALAVGGFQVLANGVLLARGLSRLPAELLKESATPRLANLLRTSWVYGMLANLCLSGLLLLIASALGKSDPLARRVALAIAAYYVVVGVANLAAKARVLSLRMMRSCSANSINTGTWTYFVVKRK